MDNALTTVEQFELAKHEADITVGLDTFYKVGNALLAIRDKKLYRANHQTFEEYCQARWGMKRNYANKLIQASVVMSNLGTVVPIAPDNESQVRELAKVIPEAQIAAWAAAVETAPGGKVTANHIAVVAHVFEGMLNTGAIDPGDGVMVATSDIVKAAITEETYERMMRQREHVASKTAHVSHNSGNNEWYTPSHIIEAARRVMGNIDLDPASSEIANQTVKADRLFTVDDNGLAQEWGGNVWLNPPYAQPAIAQFADKLASEVKAGRVRQACILVNNATETDWFATFLSAADTVCLLHSRVRFLDQSGNPSGAPLQGQVVLYVGHNRNAFQKFFAELGSVLCKA